MKNVPMILETPAPEPKIWAKEIELLYWMVGIKTGDPELLQQEKELQDIGKLDRDEQLGILDRKAKKAEKRGLRSRRKQAMGESNGANSSSESEIESEDEEHLN
jgi:hypothetical protein